MAQMTDELDGMKAERHVGADLKAIRAAVLAPSPFAPTDRVVLALLLTVASGLAWSIAPAAARAEDHAVVFAGGMMDHAKFGYLGGTIALPGSALGRGFAIRGAAFVGDYSYKGGAGQHVDANFSGGEISGLYQLSGGWGWMNVGPGIRYTDTSLAPSDPSNRRHGRQGELIISADGARLLAPWRFDWYGAYGTRLSDYQVRASLTHDLGPVVRAGLEASFEGDPTYDLQRVGPYGAIRLGDKSELQVSVGVSGQTGRGTGAYLRTGVHHSF